jgi:hypothetical protein
MTAMTETMTVTMTTTTTMTTPCMASPSAVRHGH